MSGFDPHSEREHESLLAIGNGLVGVRGAIEEGTEESNPATLFAGIFDRLPSSLYSGGPKLPALVIGPNWLKLSIYIDGEALSLKHGEVFEHERILDLRRAVMIRRWRQRLPSGRVVSFQTLRAAMLPDRHLLLQKAWLVLEDFDALVRLAAELDGHAGSGLRFTDQPAAIAGVLSSQTAAGEFRLAMAQAGHLQGDSAYAPKQAECPAAIADFWEWSAEANHVYVFDRVVSWFTSRQAKDPARCALERVRDLPKVAGSLLKEHCRAWEDRWQTSEIRIEGDERMQRAVRFVAYHLTSCAQPEDEWVSIGARGLTGTGYLGHVFWDTEIYMLPFLNFTWPAAARAVLMYRYHTLDFARQKSTELGYRGALYAWESVAGYETTPNEGRAANGETVQIQTGRFAHHISADVAYAVYQYWRVTGDDAFLRTAGIEIAIETARFWASRAVLDQDGEYHIRRVVPPDEYHELVDDSAFTNTMARFNLEFACSASEWLRERDRAQWEAITDRLSLSAEEVREWAQIARKLANTKSRGLIEEFDGYFRLEDLDLRALEPRTAALPVLLGHDKTARTQVIKQADIVLLCHLLQDRFDANTIARNFEYYEPRCDHGSSLSPSIYALAAARLGRMEQARSYLHRAASIDLNSGMGNTAQGIHSGAVGGLWQAVIMGFAGMRVVNDTLRFDPHLLPEWKSLSFPILFRGCRLEVTLRHRPEPCEFVLMGGEGIRIQLREEIHKYLTPGERKLRA